MHFGNTIADVRCLSIGVIDQAQRLRQLCERLRSKGEIMTEDNFSAIISLVNLMMEQARLTKFVAEDARQTVIETESERELVAQ